MCLDGSGVAFLFFLVFLCLCHYSPGAGAFVVVLLFTLLVGMPQPRLCAKAVLWF
jgi:hypothetical protein